MEKTKPSNRLGIAMTMNALFLLFLPSFLAFLFLFTSHVSNLEAISMGYFGSLLVFYVLGVVSFVTFE